LVVNWCNSIKYSFNLFWVISHQEEGRRKKEEGRRKKEEGRKKKEEERRKI